jgi:hypothetical protein
MLLWLSFVASNERFNTLLELKKAQNILTKEIRLKNKLRGASIHDSEKEPLGVGRCVYPK